MEMTDDVSFCKVCQPDRRVIEVDHSDMHHVSPVIVRDLEHYTFDHCHSFHTSSRNHFMIRLVLVITWLPGAPYCSAPFVFCSREIRRARTRRTRRRRDHVPHVVVPGRARVSAAPARRVRQLLEEAVVFVVCPFIIVITDEFILA